MIAPLPGSIYAGCSDLYIILEVLPVYLRTLDVDLGTTADCKWEVVPS